MQTYQKRSFPVLIGHRHMRVYAGPFHAAPVNGRVFTVRLAPEVNRRADVTVNIKDFGVPTQEDMQTAVYATIEALLQGRKVYVGCYGGIGRTGMFLACLHKVSRAYGAIHFGVPGLGAVQAVRNTYLPHAVETPGQEAFVAAFDPLPILDEIPDLERSVYGRASGRLLTRVRYYLSRRIAKTPERFARAFPAYKPGA